MSATRVATAVENVEVARLFQELADPFPPAPCADGAPRPWEVLPL